MQDASDNFTVQQFKDVLSNFRDYVRDGLVRACSLHSCILVDHLNAPLRSQPATWRTRVAV